MSAAAETPSDAVREALRRAARYRFAALLLAPPAPGRREALRALAREVSWGEGEDPRPLTEPDDEEMGDEAFRLLGQAGPVSLMASDYVEGGYADKGPILADVAGFHRAFGFTPTLREPPDHFSTLFEFLSMLAMKEAWARSHEEDEQAVVARDAEAAFLEDHVRPYLPRFADRLLAVAPPNGSYRAVGAWFREWTGHPARSS